jgi:phage terminase large subunit-like protein
VKLLEALVLDTGERWGDGALQPWQRDAFAATLGLPGAPSGDRAMVWIEGPTGCGKDQLIAAACLAALRFAPDGYEVINYSADLDRCRDVRKTVRGFIARTDERAERRGIPRWLGRGIQILRDEIRHEVLDRSGHKVARVTVHVESLDGYSASGSRADLYLLNEVQSWPDPHGARVWEESLARYDKLPHGRFAVFSNAPFTPPGDFRRDERDKAATAGSDSPWWFLGASLADCPWWSEEALERKRKSLPSHVFRRLYLCLATDGRGELVAPDIFDAAVDPQWRPPATPEAGQVYVHGLDIGVSRDHAVHLWLHRDPRTGHVYLDSIRVWLPHRGKQIDLDEIERHVRERATLFRGPLYADPYQAVQMCQRLERQGLTVQQVPFTTLNLTVMCEAVRSAFNDRKIVLFPDAGRVKVTDRAHTSLRRQVLEAEVVETERGSRIKSKRSRLGHGDELSALALALFGVTQRGLGGIPVCTRSASTPRPSRPGRPRHERLFQHSGRFIGPRARGRRPRLR